MSLKPTGETVAGNRDDIAKWRGVAGTSVAKPNRVTDRLTEVFRRIPLRTRGTVRARGRRCMFSCIGSRNDGHLCGTVQRPCLPASVASTKPPDMIFKIDVLGRKWQPGYRGFWSWSAVAFVACFISRSCFGLVVGCLELGIYSHSLMHHNQD
jgi:hypothetical protein